jgi:hypothetical protein
MLVLGRTPKPPAPTPKPTADTPAKSMNKASTSIRSLVSRVKDTIAMGLYRLPRILAIIMRKLPYMKYRISSMRKLL